MAQKKHNYVVFINGGSSTDPIIYQFGNVRGIKLSVEKQNVTISYEKGGAKKKSFQEMIIDMVTFNDRCFRDAFRKAIMVHILRFSERLNISKICISIDDEKVELTKDNDPTGGHFPYMFSLLGETEFTLGDAWKSLDEMVCSSSKTNSEDDESIKEAYSAMYSYLASKGRLYEIDRFSNLWTAMNSYYRFIAGVFEKAFVEQNGLSSFPREMKTLGNEMHSQGILERMLNQKYFFLKKNPLSKKEKEDRFRVVRLLSDIPNDEIEKLYNQANNRLQNARARFDYADVQNWAEANGTSAYTYFLIRYAYKLRCDLLHGNSHTLFISAYNSYEIHALNIVNYFLDRFLDEAIPAMFDKEKWNNIVTKKAIYKVGFDYWSNYLDKKNHNNKFDGREIKKLIGQYRKNRG